GLAAAEGGVGVGQARLARAQRLHLRAEQDQARLDPLEHLVLVTRAAVGRDDLLLVGSAGHARQMVPARWRARGAGVLGTLAYRVDPLDFARLRLAARGLTAACDLSHPVA